MAMEQDLVARLVGDAALAAIVGAKVSWFGRDRADSPPSISLLTVAPNREWTHGGPDGLDRPRVRFDLWGATPAQAWDMKYALRDLLEQGAEVGGTKFHPAMLASETTIDEGEQDRGAPLFRISQDYHFHHEEL